MAKSAISSGLEGLRSALPPGLNLTVERLSPTSVRIGWRGDRQGGGGGPSFGAQPKTRPDLAAVAVKRTPAELAALKERVKSEAIPISLGRTPDRDAIKVNL